MVVPEFTSDTGNTYFPGYFWESTSQINTTVPTQLEDRILIYSHTRINKFYHIGSLLQDYDVNVQKQKKDSTKKKAYKTLGFYSVF